MMNRGRILPLLCFGLAALTGCGGGSMGAPAEPASSTISSVSAACVPAAMEPNATAQCSATVQGTGSYSSGIGWSTSGGSITASGAFTAPASAGSVTVTATSNQNTARSGSATVTVQPAPATVTAVTLSCAPLTVLVNATSQCTASVQGTGSYSAAVTWTASAGTISANGLLNAPATAGTVSVTATSTADTTKSATLAITVQAPAAPPTPPTPTITSITASCSPATLAPGAAAQCTAMVTGTGSFSSGVTWSASAGSITGAGLFVAPQTSPASATTVLITAISTQDSTKSATTSITLPAAAAPAITSVAVACSPTIISPTATAQCAATVQGTGTYSPTVIWSASGGTITASGLLTAPATAGSVVITATSTQDPTKLGTGLVTIQAAAPTITLVSVSCAASTIAPNATSLCSATVQGTGAYSSTVTWSATGGTVNASGLFTAEATAGSAIVTATSTEDTTKTGTANITVQLQVPASKHVVIVMEENQSYSTVVGRSEWPNLNSLINEGALATNYYSDSHPSIGNYFMLTTGQLLTTSDSSTTVWNVDNIARRMLAANVPFKVYAEGITQGYVGGNTGLYLIRHNPFAMLSDVASNPQVANLVICPFSQFAIDLANNALPAFSFVVPDVEDDAHNGTPSQADAWLQTNLIAPLANQPAFQAGGDGIFIVDFDEAESSDTTHGGGRIPAVFWGPNVLAGYTQAAATVYQHESMLNTMMDALGLPNPPGLAATAPTMSEFFVQK